MAAVGDELQLDPLFNTSYLSKPMLTKSIHICIVRKWVKLLPFTREFEVLSILDTQGLQLPASRTVLFSTLDLT
jgi:hypothetical protein